MNRHLIVLLATAFVAVSSSTAPAAAFADFTAFDINSDTASGILNGISFTLTTTRAVARPISGGNGGVIEGVTNGSSNSFSSAAVFTPPLALGDYIGLGGASDFKLSFAQPITNITLHIYQLEANRLSFTRGGVLIAFSLLSSDGNLTSSSGNTAIEGSPGSSDASGSLFFSGTFSEISWTSAPGNSANVNTVEDGFRLQASVVPEPSTVLLGTIGILALALRRFCNDRNA